ncbi:MAG: ribonuclease III [Bacteroidota bacterium]
MYFFFFGLSKSDRRFSASLKNILEFSPKNLSLYYQAFRHNSVAEEIKEGIKDSNERLEFLGDAVLSIVIADFLFKKFPYYDEGFLTKMRSKIVNRNFLNQLAIKLGLNKLIQQNKDPGLKFSSINGNAFEALIGAIYLDHGFSRVSKFLVNNILKYHIDVAKLEFTETDFKSKLIEWGQREKKNVFFRQIKDGNGYDKQYVIVAMVNEEIVGNAEHYSKKKAEQLSSESACIKLGITSNLKI